MNHKASESFWAAYEALPEQIRKVADEKYKILKENPAHPSLQFKRVGRLWSVRVSQDYRALAFYDGEDYLWIWIGTHAEYDKRT